MMVVNNKWKKKDNSPLKPEFFIITLSKRKIQFRATKIVRSEEEMAY